MKLNTLIYTQRGIIMSDITANLCNFSEAVYIDTQRIFDSCSDKDCLEDLEVIFTDGSTKSIINNATFVKTKSCEVVNTYFTIEPVPFNKGFYSIDLTYIFNVVLEAYTNTGTPPQTVSGTAQFCKKVVLFGSETTAKIFTSDEVVTPVSLNSPYETLPIASVRVAEPVILDTKLVTKSKHHHHDCNCCCFPPPPLPPIPGANNDNGTTENDNIVQQLPPSPMKSVFITLGLFSIVSLSRPVSLLIPAFEYVIPQKNCSSSSDTPCELFEKIKFPTSEFFPPSIESISENNNNNNNSKC